MKKTLLLILVVFFFSCCKESKPQQVKFNTKEGLEQEDKSDRNHDLFVYEVKGTIYKKKYSETLQRYYFFIELEDGKVFKWAVKEANFYIKEVGDPVFFDYLLKSNFSEKVQ